jgi:molybdate transport system regulatory protein
MSTKFSKELSRINLHYKIWMSDRDDQGILGDGKWKILKLIEQKGSLKAACDELNYTYRRTWGNMKKIEKFFGFPLLEKHRGGSDGGNTVLTKEGKKLVRAFDTFHAKVDSVIQEGFESFLSDLKED